MGSDKGLESASFFVLEDGADGPLQTGEALHHLAPERRITWWQLAALVYVTVAGIVMDHLAVLIAHWTYLH